MEDPAASGGRPKTRQKNCSNCIPAKRRCDRRMPVCSRCAEKKIPCIYGKTTVASPFDREEFVPLSPSIGGRGFGSLPNLDYLGFMPMDSQLHAATIATGSMQNYVMDATLDCDVPVDPLLNMMGNSVPSTQDQWLVQNEQGLVTERPSSPADEEVMRAYKKMAGFCEHMEPWQLYDSKAPQYYIVNRVKSFATDIAARNATPFLHRYLYREHTPRCILSCFTVNMLYVNRTQANTTMVMRVLHNSVKELVNVRTGYVESTLVEKLARTQALFLYQIIRLFDGDVFLRAEGERDIPLLQNWLGDLCRVRDNLRDSAQLGDRVMERQAPRKWGEWVFAESVRRTIVMAHSFIALYEMMKGPEKNDDQGPWAYVHRWTLSRHLWEADSSFEFARMWKEKPQFVITNYSFEHFLQYGRGEDVDEFAEILLSVYMGVDETSEFISAKDTRR